ncbi:MAG: methylated-DNA--[protein]-cysteine S-methyltransferase [Alphaproteobacteria bacterium]
MDMQSNPAAPAQPAKAAINMNVIAEAIDYLVAHYSEQPDLEFLARRAGYEATYFQKLFKEKVGISPKRLQQYMMMRHARELLLRTSDGNEGEQRRSSSSRPSLFECAHEAGLSSASRLHDLFVVCEGVTPSTVQRRGQGLEIVYGIVPTVLGKVMIGKTPRGLCWLGFMVDESPARSLERMQAHWPLAHVRRDDNALEAEAAQLMRIWRGDGEKSKLSLDLYGTNFQLQVWQALLKIPCGHSQSYQDLAQLLGRPQASRAVGNAVGANPISLLIPCHRVIRATGIIDNYGWGSPRKKLLLALEAQI